MKIGITGTMSVGKTTLADKLGQYEKFKNYQIFTERSKYLSDLGIPLNTNSTLCGQFVFLAERATEMFSENMISDRTIYDVCAFTLSSKTIGWYEKRAFVEAARLLIHHYDLVVYVLPENIPIEDNGIREIDPEYRDKINFVIREMLVEYPPTKLVTVKGTTEERIITILSHI